MATTFITITPRNEKVKQQLSKKEIIERYSVNGHKISSKLVAVSLERKKVKVVHSFEPRYKKKKVYELLDGNEIPVKVKSNSKGQWQIQITDLNLDIVTEKQRVIIEDLNNRFSQKYDSCTWDVVGREIIV